MIWGGQGIAFPGLSLSDAIQIDVIHVLRYISSRKKGGIHFEKSKKITVFPENSTLRIRTSVRAQPADLLAVPVGIWYLHEFPGCIVRRYEVGWPETF